MKHEHLLSPISLNGLRIRNRVALSPMGIGSYNPDETVTEDYAAFLRARSADVGLIITTGARVSSRFGKTPLLGCFARNHLPGLGELARAAHDGGAALFLQLLALGGADPAEPLVPSCDVAAYREEWIGDVKPRQLETAEIRELIAEYARSAALAKEAGMDGVELDGAENFVVSDFICPSMNRRQDEYGGNFENRMRIAVEIVEGIRRECGESFPVGFKYNAYYDLPNGIDLSLGVKIAERMVEAGACYIHGWSFSKLDRPMSQFTYPPMPNLYQPRNTTVPLAENLKKHITGAPIMAVSGILKPEEADRIIGEGKADMVAVGRAFIADPHWARAAKGNSRLRPCIRCHVCHHEVAIRGKIVCCSVNPDVLGKTPPGKAERSKKVMVVGGGPGGIVAAVTAARRGHHVSLYEKLDALGGKLIPGSMPDFKPEFPDILAFLREEVRESGVHVSTGLAVTPALVREKAPDALVVAIGAVPAFPLIQGVDGAHVFQATDALLAPERLGKTVAVIGGGDVGCETALFLARRGKNVTIVELLDELMKDEEIKYNTVILQEMIRQACIRVHVLTRVTAILPGRLAIKRNEGADAELPADSVVLSTGYSPQEAAVQDLRDSCEHVFAVGDCVSPNRLRQAISEGYRSGCTV